MSAESSRFVALWASHERRARVWFAIALTQSLLLAVSLFVTIQLLRKPREVVRIACDGIPTVVRLDDAKYSEPNEIEVRAFASLFAAMFARGDSGSVINDYVWCAKHMTPQLRERFKTEARGSGDRPGAIQVVQSLNRHSDVDASTMKIEVDKKPYPWVVKVSGVRQIVGQPEGDQTFTLELQLVKTSREEVLEGVLVWDIKSEGGPVGAGFIGRR